MGESNFTGFLTQILAILSDFRNLNFIFSPFQVEFFMTFHVKCVVIIAQANITEFMLAMDALASLSAQFAAIASMSVNQSQMVSAWLTRRIVISAARAD